MRISIAIFIAIFTISICTGPSLGSVSDLQTRLQTEGIQTSQQKAVETGIVYRTGGVGLNFRTGPWKDVMKVLPDNTKLEILAKEGDWVKVKADGKTGYVHTQYVTTDKKEAKTEKYEDKNKVDVPSNSWLNVRSSPWGTKIGKLRRGDKVEILGHEGDWVKVKHGDKTAYVHGDYLKKKVEGGPSGAVSGSSTPAATASGPVGAGWGGNPCAGRISSEFGMRTHPISGTRKMHSGIDVAAGAGTQCKSLGPGKVIFRGWNDGYGNMVKIQHDNGYVSYYAHLKSYNVSNGQRVGQNQVVAFVNSTGSSTGNHLHFELRKNGTAVNPRSVPGVTF